MKKRKDGKRAVGNSHFTHSGTSPTDINRNEVYQRVSALYMSVANVYRYTGGTVSSNRLQEAIDLESQIEQLKFDGGEERESKLLALALAAAIIRLCQKSLQRHNAQPLRFYTYNVLNGDVIYENLDYESNLEKFKQLHATDPMKAQVFLTGEFYFDEAHKAQEMATIQRHVEFLKGVETSASDSLH